MKHITIKLTEKETVLLLSLLNANLTNDEGLDDWNTISHGILNKVRNEVAVKPNPYQLTELGKDFIEHLKTNKI